MLPSYEIRSSMIDTAVKANACKMGRYYSLQSQIFATASEDNPTKRTQLIEPDLLGVQIES